MGITPEQRDRIRTVYVEQRQNDADVVRLGELLSCAGFRYAPTTQELTWETQETDFQMFDAVVEFLVTTMLYEDEAFEEALQAFSRELLAPWSGKENYTNHEMPLFVRLQDPCLPRSLPHQPRTPFEHSLDVLQRVVSIQQVESGRPVDEVSVIGLRLAAIMHDIGKVVIARHDYNHDHSFISALILETYFRNRGVLTHTSQAIVSYVGNHHLIELMNFDLQAFSPEEIMNFMMLPSDMDEEGVAFPDLIQSLITLSLADPLSVPEYQVFAVFVIHSFYEIYRRVSLSDRERLTPFFLQLCELTLPLVAEVQKNNVFSSVSLDVMPAILEGMVEMQVITARELSKHQRRFVQI